MHSNDKWSSGAPLFAYSATPPPQRRVVGRRCEGMMGWARRWITWLPSFWLVCEQFTLGVFQLSLVNNQ